MRTVVASLAGPADGSAATAPLSRPVALVALPSLGWLSSVDPLAALAVVLLVAGVVGSLLPVLPGGALTLAGTYAYWWSTGFGPPGVAFVAVATLLALTAIAVDVFGGAVAAGAAGTSKRTAAVAGVVGLALALVTGPLGILVGIAGTVYVAELRAGTDHRESLRTAGKTLVGVLVANGIQFVLTSLVLLGFVVVWVV